MRTQSLRRILSRGLGRLSSLNLALVGSFHSATDGTGRTTSGDRAKNPAAKSSTMKGAKALESKFHVETEPNREQSSPMGRRALLVSALRNGRTCPAETALGREAETCGDGVEVAPPSNVTRGTLGITNPGRSIAAALVWRCSVGSGVFETQWTGRVVQVGAAEFERCPQANSLQGSGEVVSLAGWHRSGTNNERADG